MKPQFLIFDYETRSRCKLDDAGAYEYARDPSTEILCAAVTRGDFETVGTDYTLFKYIDDYSPLREWLNDPRTYVVAHNKQFEELITTFVLGGVNPIPHERWICTAATARYHGMPGNLEDLSLALGLQYQKDMIGHKLMLKMSKPKKDGSWHYTAADMDRLAEYCVSDVKAEVQAFKFFKPMPPIERRIWALNQEINMRGIRVDRQMAEGAVKIIAEETIHLDRETHTLTGGRIESTRQLAELQRILFERGTLVEDLRAETVRETLLKPDLDPVARRLLQIRQTISKSSIKKYPAVLDRSGFDGYIRDILMYAGAHTLRDSGMGFQPQNLPRGTVELFACIIDVIRAGDRELLRLLYGDAIEVLSTALRSVLQSDPGKLFYSGDFSTIEVIVLFWLAGHTEGLEAFRTGQKLYEPMGAEIYGVPVEQVIAEYKAGNIIKRQIGKNATLGAGFGMGWEKFIDDVKDKTGIVITPALSKTAINTYRKKHNPVVQFWYAMERAAVGAILERGNVFRAGMVKWYWESPFLICELPGGHKLHYHKPEIEYLPVPWNDDLKPTLFHSGYVKDTRKWGKVKTYGGRLVENAVQSCARHLMKHAELNLHQAGFQISLTVHDEVLAQGYPGREDEFRSIMLQAPEWAGDMPIKVGVWSGERYKK